MELKAYQDIYRGYIIDYNPTIEPHFCNVLNQDGSIAYEARSFDAACVWIDRSKRKMQKD